MMEFPLIFIKTNVMEAQNTGYKSQGIQEIH